MTEARFNPSLSADDPRLSEWLDGRVPEADAAQIARLVAASPELTRMVADLRRQKAALAGLPTAPPPAQFVEAVLAALDAAGDTADDDAEVEAEWRRIERERLEEEIAEAREDAAEAADEPMRHRWPWLALAAALAAGVLAAVVINRPGGMGDREVALVEPQQREQSETQRGAAEAGRGDKAAARDTWLEEGAAASDSRVADRTAGAHEAKGLAAGAPETRDAAKRNTMERDRAEVERQDGSPDVGGEAGSQLLAAQAAPTAEAAHVAQAADAANEPQVRSVTYRIRTAADRQRLESLLAASGRATDKKANREFLAKGREPVQREAATVAADTAGEAPRVATPQDIPVSERIAISGPADVMVRLAAALEADSATEAETEAAKKPSGLPAAPTVPVAADGETDVTLIIMVLDESGATVEADEGRP